MNNIYLRKNYLHINHPIIYPIITYILRYISKLFYNLYYFNHVAIFIFLLSIYTVFLYHITLTKQI